MVRCWRCSTETTWNEVVYLGAVITNIEGPGSLPAVFDLLVAAALNRTQDLVDGSKLGAELQVGTKTVEIDGEIVQVPYWTVLVTLQQCHCCAKAAETSWQHTKKKHRIFMKQKWGSL